MIPEQARKIVAVQAIEQSDPDDLVLTDSDRREAGASAGAPLPKDAESWKEDRFLSERAELLLVRASSRHGDSARWFRQPIERHRFGWLLLGLCLVAAILGFLTNELGPERRINILSFPLLGIVAWSLFVYLREAVLFFRRRGDLFRDGWLEALVRFVQPTKAPPFAEGEGEKGKVLAAAATLFSDRWRGLLAPVTGARLKSMLHLVAFVLAASAIAGMYVKGLANEYRAVWESTFFEEGAELRPFLRTVLGPAAALKGEAIPSAAELDAIHWRAAEEEVAGESAARWIHWYAITIGLFVLLPRLFLAASWRWRASRLARTLPIREVSPGYYERLLAVSKGKSLDVLVAPYAVPVDDDLRRAVRSALEDRFERAVEPEWLATVAFGEEEEVELPDAQVGTFIPVFDFAATPEKETHRALLDRYATLLNEGPNRVECLFLDTTGFDRKAISFADAEKRRADREDAWRILLEGSGVEPVFFTRLRTAAI